MLIVIVLLIFLVLIVNNPLDNKNDHVFLSI